MKRNQVEYSFKDDFKDYPKERKKSFVIEKELINNLKREFKR